MDHVFKATDAVRSLGRAKEPMMPLDVAAPANVARPPSLLPPPPLAATAHCRASLAQRALTS